MTPNEAAELIKNKDHFCKLVEAFAQGKLEFCDAYSKWITCTGNWSMDNMLDESKRYRIKPEPREWWAIETNLFSSFESANNYNECLIRNGYTKKEIIHVREVEASL